MFYMCYLRTVCVNIYTNGWLKVTTNAIFTLVACLKNSVNQFSESANQAKKKIQKRPIASPHRSRGFFPKSHNFSRKIRVHVAAALNELTTFKPRVPLPYHFILELLKTKWLIIPFFFTLVNIDPY